MLSKYFINPIANIFQKVCASSEFITSLFYHPIFFEESHISFPLSAHTGIRRGLPRPRFSLTAYLAVVGIS